MIKTMAGTPAEVFKYPREQIMSPGMTKMTLSAKFCPQGHFNFFIQCPRERIVLGVISTLLRIVPELENVQKSVKSKKSVNILGFIR